MINKTTLTVSLLLVWCFAGKALYASINAGKQSASKGYALMVGLRVIDVKMYKKRYSSIATAGAGKDLEHMQQILLSSGFERQNIDTILDTHATRENVLEAVQRTARRLKPNDLFVLYFTGHGDSIPDISGDELDGYDEELVAYDKYILDDDLYKIWNTVHPSIRIVMIVDACHSGTSFKMVDFKVNRNAKTRAAMFANEANFNRNTKKVAFNAFTGEFLQEKFQMIYIGAASDEGTAVGGSSGSLFTNTLLALYLERRRTSQWFSYTYPRFAQEIAIAVGSKQRISYHEIGPVQITFKNTYPFKIR